MTDQDSLERLLRSALPPTAAASPSRDLWPLVRRRSSVQVTWSWLDTSLIVVVAIAFWIAPGWLWLLAYHL